MSFVVILLCFVLLAEGNECSNQSDFLCETPKSRQKDLFEINLANAFNDDVVSAYLGDNFSDSCRRDVNHFIKSLRNFDLWALKSK